MAYFIMKLFSRIICLLPVRLSRKIGDLIGNITWYIVPQRRKLMAFRNVKLSLKLSDAESYQITKQSWTRFGRMIVEVMRFPKILPQIQSYVKIVGRENLDEALALGRGAIIATAHSGNWELLGAALATNKYPLIAVAKKQNNGNMDRLINEYRTLAGQHVTYKTGVREMVRFLGEGKIIGLLMDQDAGSDGVILDFFGRKASCAQGAAFLGRLKTAPILPTFITENADGTHTITVGQMLWVAETAKKHDDIANMTNLLIQKIEEHVRQYPREWFWLHNRWKYTDKIGLND